VWPHDNGFIAAGLARYGFRHDAAKIIAGIFEAAWFFKARLPEVFSGYDRGNTRYPVQYPTACLPQAWAAASPMLAIRTLLGLEPKGDVLTSADDPVLPRWIGTLSLDGIPGRWGRAKVVVKGDETAMLSTRQIYEHLLAAREELDKQALIA
jgi:glycogen debranching enzyme